MARLVDQYGNPIDQTVLGEPQTARVASLANEYLTSQLDGLTPARLASTLRQADHGDLWAQHRLFSDMEERDAHLYAEMGKRKRAILCLDWSIEPPRNASAAEKGHADWLTEVLTDAADPFEELLVALMDGVGHGFSPVELEWRREGGELLPEFHPRPQEWFRLDLARRELRLRDNSPEGAPLQPFGWVMHTYGKAKTGYLGRMGLHRVLVWPFLYKAYSIGDFAEFLETFGLPIIVGKYFAGATPDEKASLMRAVTALGHDARAIMPADMQLEIQKIVSGGDKSPHLAMVDWAERSQSKTILGQTMSAEAKSTGIGSGNADLHDEVRHDILKADARQIEGTVTRDLLYPLVALNRGQIDGLSRCPRLVFDTGEAEDLGLYADALPKLAAIKMQIPVAWAHEKLRIPLPAEGEGVLGASEAAPAAAAPPIEPPKPPSAGLAALAEDPDQEGVGRNNQRALRQPAVQCAALIAPYAADLTDPTPATALADRLQIEAGEAWRAVLAHIEGLVASAETMEGLQAALLTAYDGLPLDDLRAVMASGFAVAQLAGLAEVRDEAARAGFDARPG